MDASELAENWKRACRKDELTRRFPEPIDQSDLVSHVFSRVRGIRQPPDPIIVGAAAGFASSDYEATGEAKYLQLAMLVKEAAKHPEADHKAALDVLALVGQATVALLLDTWRGEAEVDELTRLGNRRKMEKFVATLTSAESRFAYASIDADGLKDVNDSLGHDAGDAFLRSIGDELGHVAVDISAEAFRYGGDEFGIVVPVGVEVESLGDALRGAQERIASLGYSFSAGVAIWPDEDRDHHTVIKVADRRMYEQKQKKKGAVRAGDEGTDAHDL